MKKDTVKDKKNGMACKFLSWCVGLFLLVSCGDDDQFGSYTPGQESREVYLEATQGTKSIQIKTNGSWSVSLDEATGRWIKIEGATSGSGDAPVELFYTQNPSFNRLGRVLFTVAGADVPDTLYIKQYGKTPVLDLKTKQSSIPVFGGNDSIEVYTNLPVSLRDRATLELIYQSEEKDWVSNLKLSSDLKRVSYKVAENNGAARLADLLLVFTDDWGKRWVSSCHLQQARKGGTSQTKQESFDNIRKLIASPSGSLTITDDVMISGVVISDCDNPNVAENPNPTWNSIDFNVNYQTAYVQEKNGVRGFKLSMVSRDVNILHQYDRLDLWLKGLTLVKESNPERYTISGITHDHYVAVAPGAKTDVVNKERFIGDLTDLDLYTFVKLKECELPIRKGSYTPVNEGYGQVYTGAARVDKYPLLIRDSRGDVSYLWTNFACPYRRDGSVLPQGSGSLSGILVCEPYSRFESDGNIGKYQLRHLSKEDIAISQSASNGFSKLICEWTGYVANGTKASPTSGAGELYHSSGKAMGTSTDHSYPGPITGVESEDKKGAVSNAAISIAGWWNSGKGESWIVKFSTAGLSGKSLSLQLGTYSSKIGAPRYWLAETSTHGNPDGSWEKAGEYTVPDVVDWSNTQLHQLSGWKNLNIALPVSLLGRSEVYVRLRVSSNKAGTSTSYDGGTILSDARNIITYLSVRYN